MASNSKGLGQVYYMSMRMHRDRIAQIDGDTKEERTFDDLLTRCIQAASAMRQRGVEVGDFVSVCSHNHFDDCVPYVASIFIGAVTAAVEPSMSVQEMVYLLKQVSPKIIFVSERSVGVIEEVVEELGTDALIVVFGNSTKHINFSEFVNVESNGDFCPREPDSLEETALVIFSSGTTGRPKGICHSHNAILSEVRKSKIDDYATLASFTSPYWNVFTIFLHISLANGYGRVIFADFDFNNPWKILNFKIDCAFLNPLQAMAFVQHPKPDHINVGNITFLLVGGNYLSKENIMKLNACFPKSLVRYTYGQTEFFGNALDFPHDAKGMELLGKYPDSVGIPCEGVSLKIVDVETETTLGPNQQGELRLKMAGKTKGYYNKDSSDVFDSDGWLKTGDIAYYNEENCVFIVGRMKESFKFQSYHVIPTEIESVLLSHPAISNGVVIGLPNEADFNHAMAVVVLREEGKDVPVEEIIEYVDKRVGYKDRLRGGVKIVDKLPLTVTDKVSRYKLREIVLNNEL